jgi:hypothetical protein
VLLTAIAAGAWAVVFASWGLRAAYWVPTVWFGLLMTALTNDPRPALHTPRSVLRKVRP